MEDIKEKLKQAISSAKNENLSDEEYANLLISTCGKDFEESLTMHKVYELYRSIYIKLKFPSGLSIISTGREPPTIYISADYSDNNITIIGEHIDSIMISIVSSSEASISQPRYYLNDELTNDIDTPIVKLLKKGTNIKRAL